MEWQHRDRILRGLHRYDPVYLSRNGSNGSTRSFRDLSAYAKDGHAEVLSNPSILVLDGRQARIQVGRQVPNQSTLVQGTQSFASINYIPTGIVLNIRPRITEDGSEVTMQIETIVSNAVF